jgi:hypothetical protein
MKAWHVDEGGGECNLLIFAADRHRARYIAWTHGTWEFDSYQHIRARRAPKWDGLFDAEKVIDVNEDLPPGAEPFYSDEEYVI